MESETSQAVEQRSLGRDLRILEVIEGLSKGLSRFAYRTRISLTIIDPKAEKPSRFDVEGLLEKPSPDLLERSFEVYGHRLTFHLERPLGLGSMAVVDTWLEYASRVLGAYLALAVEEGVPGGLRRLVEQYAPSAVSRVIDEACPGITGPHDPLEVILALARLKEEGRSPGGSLVLVSESDTVDLEMPVRFAPETAPSLGKPRSARKLLQLVEDTPRSALIACGNRIVGVGRSRQTCPNVRAQFRADGVDVVLNGQLLCQVESGRLCVARSRHPLLPSLRTLLSEFEEEFRIHLEAVALTARRNRSGCLIVVARTADQRIPNGHQLAEPLSLAQASSNRLVHGLARVDGAVFLDSEGRIRAFGCLLAGNHVPGEEAFRGARHCAAYRYTAENPDVVAMVVSEDGPITYFAGGRALPSSDPDLQ